MNATITDHDASIDWKFKHIQYLSLLFLSCVNKLEGPSRLIDSGRGDIQELYIKPKVIESLFGAPVGPYGQSFHHKHTNSIFILFRFPASKD